MSELMFGRALRCNIVKLNCFDYSSSVFERFTIFLRNIWVG